MNFNEYQAEALKVTTSPNSSEYDLIQAGLGLSILVGEFNTAVHVHALQKTPLNPAIEKAFIEKAGNILWFLAFACETLGITMNSVAKKNLADVYAKIAQEKSREDTPHEANIPNVTSGQESQEAQGKQRPETRPEAGQETR